MNCAGDLQAPAPNKGYWVDRSSYDYVDELYACSRKTCKGSHSLSECWDYSNKSAAQSHACNKDNVLCIAGSKGPICGKFSLIKMTHTQLCISLNLSKYLSLSLFAYLSLYVCIHLVCV
jgi:hypothetical protein